MILSIEIDGAPGFPAECGMVGLRPRGRAGVKDSDAPGSSIVGEESCLENFFENSYRGFENAKNCGRTLNPL